MRSVALLALAACGPSAAELARREAEPFRCKDRSVAYSVSHHMAGPELGVLMDCADAGPRIKRWKLAADGKRTEDGRAMTPKEFDDIWNQIDGSGWPNMGNCRNGTNGKRDPIYTFDVHDDQNKASFSCQSKEMPFPYNTIVDPLDFAAQKSGHQLGDDEPGELKALDKKQPK